MVYPMFNHLKQTKIHAPVYMGLQFRIIRECKALMTGIMQLHAEPIPMYPKCLRIALYLRQ